MARTTAGSLKIDEPRATVEKMLITRRIARDWIENKRWANRHLREKDYHKYARLQEGGKWLFNGDAIRFADDPKTGEEVLIDGQHRLHTIDESGIPMWVFVVRHLDITAQATIDSGRRRTPADDLSIAGVANAVFVAATARLALSIESDSENWDHYEVTAPEVSEWVAEHPEVHSLVDYARTVSHRSLVPTAILAYSLWRFRELGALEEAYAFWDSAANKVHLIEDDPITALTNKISDCRRSHSRLSQAMYLSLIFRAWNARRAGETLKWLRLTAAMGRPGSMPEPK